MRKNQILIIARLLEIIGFFIGLIFIFPPIVQAQESFNSDSEVPIDSSEFTSSNLITPSTIPESDALPTDTYTVQTEVLINGQTVTNILAENIPINDIPRTPHILRSTETQLIPIIPAFVDIDPDTLNLKNQGKWVTAYLELLKGYDINKIDLQSIRLNGQIPIESRPITIGDYDNNNIPDLMVKFDRKLVQNILQPENKVKIIVSGFSVKPKTV